MSELIVDDDVAAKLNESTEPVELCTRDGRRLGTFTPSAPSADPAAEATRMRALLDEIARTRYPLAPGTPDSTEMLREDRAR